MNQTKTVASSKGVVRVFSSKGAVVRVQVPASTVPRMSVGSFYCCCGDGNQTK